MSMESGWAEMPLIYTVNSEEANQREGREGNPEFILMHDL